MEHSSIVVPRLSPFEIVGTFRQNAICTGERSRLSSWKERESRDNTEKSFTTISRKRYRRRMDSLLEIRIVRVVRVLYSKLASAIPKMEEKSIQFSPNVGTAVVPAPTKPSPSIRWTGPFPPCQKRPAKNWAMIDS